MNNHSILAVFGICIVVILGYAGYTATKPDLGYLSKTAIPVTGDNIPQPTSTLSTISTSSTAQTPPHIGTPPPEKTSEKQQKLLRKTRCYVGGCSGQLCTSDLSAVSTCEYRESYACYKSALCEVQATGECGWTQTNELAACLSQNGSI